MGLRNERPLSSDGQYFLSVRVRCGLFFSRSARHSVKVVTFAHDASFRVLYLSRPKAACPLYASTIPAYRHVAGMQEPWSRRLSSRCASRRGTKPEATVSARPPSRRVMKLIDPRRSAIVRRYAADLADHNGNSDGYAQAELDLLCMGTHEHEARLSPAPLTTSQPATGRFHTS